MELRFQDSGFFEDTEYFSGFPRKHTASVSGYCGDRKESQHIGKSIIVGYTGTETQLE